MTGDGVHPQVARPRAPRTVARSVGRSLLTATGLVWIYFVVPVEETPSGPRVVLLAVGVLVVSSLLAWQIRAIARSRTPWLRAVEALAMVVPLYLLLFAFFYYVLGLAGTTEFSQSLSRVDALYLTVTIFTTVGFGDIVAVSQFARVVVTAQMMLNVVLIGAGLRVVLKAVQVGLARQAGSAQTQER